jgi:minor extracellular serine protease Vpr
VVTGVAPEVTFGAYRVFGCEGSTFADIMLAAMEMAFADKMDVLNMSIGSAFQWPQYPTAQASDRMVNRGMVVVASIGNSGANGLYSAGAPGLGEKVIGVASFDNTEVYVPYFEVNDTPIGYIAMTFSGPVPTEGTEEIVYIGQACDADLPLLADPAGKVALAVRGTCAFAEKATNAIERRRCRRGDSQQRARPLQRHPGCADRRRHPGRGHLAGGWPVHPRAGGTGLHDLDRQMVSAPNPTGGLISSFSSYGLSPDLALKPDIGAPGGNIYSTYPLEGGGYATLSGTSMSSPHVAGAVALLLEAKPKTKAWEVRDILQNSAEPKNWWGNPGLGFLDNVHRQGAGMLQIDKAIEAIAQITPAKIAAARARPGRTRPGWRSGTTPPSR